MSRPPVAAGNWRSALGSLRRWSAMSETEPEAPEPVENTAWLGIQLGSSGRVDLLGGGDPCGFNFWEPEYVAWLIETHVRPDRLDRAIALIDDYARGEPHPERRRFWNAVLRILAPS